MIKMFRQIIGCNILLNMLQLNLKLSIDNFEQN